MNMKNMFMTMRDEMELDKVKPNVACYDFKAIMNVPADLALSFYYKNKLSCYNFIVSNLNLENVQCYFWIEIENGEMLIK